MTHLYNFHLNVPNKRLEYQKIACDGDKVERGKVLISPSDQHMMLKLVGNEYAVTMNSGELVNRHWPSVDVLFRSVANLVGKSQSE